MTAGIVLAVILLVGGAVGLQVAHAARPAATPHHGVAVVAAGQCLGLLVRHEDGAVACHGGLDDCWGTQHPHRRSTACRDLTHGCGTCLIGGAR